MKDGFVKVAVATPEVRVADCVFNREKTQELIRQAAEQGVKLLVLPELGLTGYTCGDLFYQRTLLDGAEKELAKLALELALRSYANQLACQRILDILSSGEDAPKSKRSKEK